jgi:hypothetical protein
MDIGLQGIYITVLMYITSVKPSKLVAPVKAKSHQSLDETSIHPINTIIKISV